MPKMPKMPKMPEMPPIYQISVKTAPESAEMIPKPAEIPSNTDVIDTG